MNELTIVESSIGGILIGTSAAANMLLFGRVTGISGILGNLLRPSPTVFASTNEKTWRCLFVSGIILASAVASAADPSYPAPLDLSALTYTLSGVAVGLGTRIGNGCTSGHGICGLARFSPRSLVAVSTFMAVGILTASLTGLQKSAGGPWRLAPVSWPPNILFAVIGGLVVIVMVGLSAVVAKRAVEGGSPWAQYALGAVHLMLGATFGIGLAVAGMLDQRKIIGFLDLSGARFGAWDPSLAFVMGGGLLVNAIAHYVARRDETMRPALRPEADFYFRPDSCSSPPKNWKDPKLVIGSAFFGLGWGMGGICPGPALGGLVFPFSSPSTGSMFTLWIVAYSSGVWLADAALAAARGEVLQVETPSSQKSKARPPSPRPRIAPTDGSTDSENSEAVVVSAA